MVVRQAFGRRDGYVLQNAEGRYVFVTDLAAAVLADLDRGIEISEIARRCSADEADVSRIARMRVDCRIPAGATEKVGPRTEMGRPRAAWALMAFSLLLTIAGLAGWVSLPNGIRPALQSPVPAFHADGVRATWIAGLVAIVLVHESAHLGVCWLFGQKPGGVRLRRIGLLPAIVSNVTAAWALSRHQRVGVAVAGPVASLACAGVFCGAIAVGGASPLNGAFASLAYASLFIGVFSLLPFHRFDGYFALSALCDVPNLEARARDALARCWRRRRLALSPMALYGLAASVVYVAGASLLLARGAQAVSAGQWARAVLPVGAVAWWTVSATRAWSRGRR